MTHRLMPPASGLAGTISVNGRNYTCAQGSTIDVSTHDAMEMVLNGWVDAATAGAGATTARPTNPQNLAEYLDTTLGYIIRFDGLAWRNPLTGAAV